MKDFPLKTRDLKRLAKNATPGTKLSPPYAFLLTLTTKTDYFHTVVQYFANFSPI